MKFSFTVDHCAYAIKEFTLVTFVTNNNFSKYVITGFSVSKMC